MEATGEIIDSIFTERIYPVCCFSLTICTLVKMQRSNLFAL